MANFKLNINNNAVVQYTNRLEKMHSTILPKVVLGALNDVAFKLKKITLPNTAKKTFKERQPNFFKANSRVEPAKGSNMDTMVATVGMVSTGLHNSSTNYSVKELEAQEHGGAIPHKTFIAQKGARAGKGNVKAKFRLAAVKSGTFITAKRRSKSRYGKSIMVSKKQAFIRAAIVAKQTGANFVLGNRNANGNRTLSIINSLSSSRSSHKLNISRTAIYSVKAGRVTKVARHDFMKRAATEAFLEMEPAFIRRAQKEFKKAGVM